jgi:hypothetical protein
VLIYTPHSLATEGKLRQAAATFYGRLDPITRDVSNAVEITPNSFT